MRNFDRNSLLARILIVFVVFNIVSIFVFSFYMVQRDHRRVERLAEESIIEIALEKAEVISLAMNYIANETEYLAMWTMEYIETTDDITLDSSYVRTSDGVLYRRSFGEMWEKDHSGIFLPADIPINDDQIRLINATERLEPIFSTIHDKVNYYEWSYIATENGLLRFYPYTGTDVYEPHHQQKQDPFYVVANKENNPERKTVWTKPYIDYFGTGWMVTCSSPLYQGDEFIGVACSDVRLDTLKANFLEDFRLSDSGFAFLLDNEGGIIYHPNFLPQGNKEGQQFLTNILEEPSVSQGYREALKKVLNDDGSNKIVSYRDESDGYSKRLIAYVPIEEQGWTLAVEINFEDYMAKSSLEPSDLFIYLVLISVTLLIFALFMYRQYAKPIMELKVQAEDIAQGNFGRINAPSKYSEIKALSDAFNSMSKELGTFTSSLIQKNKEIESIFNSISGLLMIIDTNYNIIIINEKGKEALVNNQTDPIGSKCYKTLVNRNKPCQGCKVHEIIKSANRNTCRLSLKEEIINNSYYPILNEDKEVVEIIVFSQKVTKSVLMEKELVQKEKLAGIGQISSAIAHELKNPLAIIKGAAYLLKVYTKEENDDRVKETVDIISGTVESAEKTIYNLLDYSGPGKDNMEWIDVQKVVNQILFLSNKERIKKEISVSINLRPEPLIYYGQIEPLKNILQNLIANALNALQEGGHLQIAGGYRYRNKKTILEIMVSDNGPGISEHIMNEIFKPFITGDCTGKGTGLGLWVTKIMVEKMKGEILVSTEKNKGTTFTIELPVVKDKEKNNGVY